MSDFREPPSYETTQIIPVTTDPRLARRDQWNDDRTGRFVIVGMVMALAFLLVAAMIWWAGGRTGSSEALATSASTIAPPAEPPVTTEARTAAGSTLPLSSLPLPARGLVNVEPTEPPPPGPSETAPPVAQAVTSEPVVVETTTTVGATTTVAPSTTVALRAATAPSTTAAPSTTIAAKTAPPTTTIAPTTTAAPPTTVAGPVVTSPPAADATLLDVVRDTPDLSRAWDLVQTSGFAAELDAERELTFLAPSNAAIDAWATTVDGETVLSDPDAVYDLLLRHLVPEALDEATVFTRSSLDTVSGARLAIRQQSHTIDGADLLVVDVSAANGYLHVVSDVLTGA